MNRIILTLVFLFSFQLFSSAQRYLARPDKFGLGVGPSFLFGDNSGTMSDFDSRLLPTASIDFTRYWDKHFDIRGTLGWQRIGKGDFYSENLISDISAAGFFDGFFRNMIYADLMPVYIFNPDRRGFMPSLVKVYGGLGVGVFHSFKITEIGTINGGVSTTEMIRGNNSGIYFPVRIGAYIEFPDINGEIGLEGASLFSPFSNMEGIVMKENNPTSDIAIQLQLFYRFYFW